jgi:glutaminase
MAETETHTERSPFLKQLQEMLDHVVEVAAQIPDRGSVANYIQELSQVDPNKFGIAIALASGEVLSAGDAREPFSIQSISKVFTLALALGRLGDRLWSRVGREPSGLAFNSILQLEQENGIPRNPFVNAGALVVTDAVLATSEPRELLGELLRFIREASADEDVRSSQVVARSEAETGERNRALAHMLKAQGNLNNTPDRVLGAYFHQCAVEMSCVQLAKAGRFLIGTDQSKLIPKDKVRRINALMMLCGHYDGSGDFAYRVGLPGKSGVGGGILVIVPQKSCIAVWSPGLDDRGNSKIGTMAAELLAERMGWSIFH